MTNISTLPLGAERTNPRLDVNGYYFLFAGTMDGFKNRFMEFSEPFTAPQLTLPDLLTDALAQTLGESQGETLGGAKDTVTKVAETLLQIKQLNVSKHYGVTLPLYNKATFNISVSGIKLSLEQAYHPDTDVVVSLFFNDYPHGPLHLAGKVVRSEWGRQGRYDVKIRFQSLTDNEREIIKGHVETALSKLKSN